MVLPAIAGGKLLGVIFGAGSLVASVLSRVTTRHARSLARVADDERAPLEARQSLRAAACCLPCPAWARWTGGPATG